jgi:hypothetical protein
VAPDPDADAVAVAEAAVNSAHPSHSLSLAEAQAWVTRIAHAEDLEPPVVVRASLSRRLDAVAVLDDGVIAVRTARPTQLTLLHEMAHLLGAPGHGPHFRKVYGDLIARYLSPEHATAFTEGLAAMTDSETHG